MVKPNNACAAMWKKGSNCAEVEDTRTQRRRGGDAHKQGKHGGEQVPVFKPSLKWYTYTITCLGKQGFYQQALAVLQEMEIRGVQPNIYTYNAAIGALARAGKYAQSLTLLLEMEKKNIQPDVISYNSSISACAKSERPDMCLQLLEQMKERTLHVPYSPKPDSITYNTCISACEKANQWHECLCLLREMQDQKLDVDKMAFNNTLLALERGRKWMLCTLLFGEMRTYTRPVTGAPVEPDCVSFSVTANAFCNIQDWVKLRKHLAEMQTKQMSLDLRTYQRLVALTAVALTEHNDASNNLLSQILKMVLDIEEQKTAKKKNVRKNGAAAPRGQASNTHVAQRSQPSQPSQRSRVSESAQPTAGAPTAPPASLVTQLSPVGTIHSHHGLAHFEPVRTLSTLTASTSTSTSNSYAAHGLPKKIHSTSATSMLDMSVGTTQLDDGAEYLSEFDEYTSAFSTGLSYSGFTLTELDAVDSSEFSEEQESPCREEEETNSI